MAYEQIMFPLLIQGIGAPFFFVPLTALALANVKSNEVASAAGLMSFLRTLSGAISTSIVTTAWDDKANILRNDIAGRIKSPEQVAMMLGDVSEVGVDTALYLADQTLQNQTIMLSTNHIFLIVSLTFALSALAIWLVPKTTRKVDAPAH